MQFNRKGTFDALLEMHDGAAAITADGAGQVDSAAKVLDLGGAHTVNGQMIVDVSAFDTTTGDEVCSLKLQGSNTAAFGGTDIVDLATLSLGDATQLPGAADETTGLFEVPFVNRKSLAGTMTTFRYLRVYFDVGGTSPSITCTAYLTK